MKLYPLMANLENRPVLVVGGGTVATRKVKALLKAGAAIRVVSPELSDELQSLADTGRIVANRRGYVPSDLDGVWLVFAATNDPDLNAAISREAARRNLLGNDITHPEVCTFFVPSHIRRGDLILAISTSGRSPALAKWLRRKLEREIGPEYATLAGWIGTIRDYLLDHSYTHEQIRALSEALLEEKNLLTNIKTNNQQALADILERSFKTVLSQTMPAALATSLGLP